MKYKISKVPWHKRVYALYKGDDFITEGTFKEISEETNKSIDTLRYMTYPIYKKRKENSRKCLRMISLDD